MRNRSTVGSANVHVAIFMTIVVLLFVMAVSYAMYNKQNQGLQVRQLDEQGLQVAMAAVPEFYEKDTDGDGLADWEEALWSTDPQKADSDGDGKSDGEEVSSGTDPVVVGSGSRPSDQGEEGDALSTPEPEEELTSTDIVARELFGTFMLSLQEGEQLSPAEQERIAKEALQAAMPLLTLPTFSVSEVNVVPETETSRLYYVDRIRVIANDISAPIVLGDVYTEYDALNVVVSGETEKGQEMMKEAIAHYQKFIEPLSTLPVPTDAAMIHAQFIEALMQYVHVLGGFSTFKSDPLRGAASLRMFLSIDARLQNANAALGAYLLQHSPKNTTQSTTI